MPNINISFGNDDGYRDDEIRRRRRYRDRMRGEGPPRKLGKGGAIILIIIGIILLVVGGYVMKNNLDLAKNGVTVTGKVIDIEDVVKKGVLKKKGNAYILPLSPDAGGKEVVGSAIVLFRLINPPPKPPKLKFPRPKKGSWTQNFA